MKVKKTFELELKDNELKSYTIEKFNLDWWELSCSGTVIAKLVSEEECRRVIWSYWTNLGYSIPVIEIDDFKEI